MPLIWLKVINLTPFNSLSLLLIQTLFLLHQNFLINLWKNRFSADFFKKRCYNLINLRQKQVFSSGFSCK
ncbi:hypothetical protein L1987_80349 [Smallanthus sonchifolius]|uniref:Uncharacterized protein n=1 Tax=Smallanthus sonchifolius TaxID=185202 RepID=A0ACB8YNH4_9ASTR|nr:hypothetical protein L1987_80349 [Smallanthus sonchifolius]